VTTKRKLLVGFEFDFLEDKVVNKLSQLAAGNGNHNLLTILINKQNNG